MRGIKGKNKTQDSKLRDGERILKASTLRKDKKQKQRRGNGIKF